LHGLIRYNGTNLVQVISDNERMAAQNIENFSNYNIQYYRIYNDSSAPSECFADYAFLDSDFKLTHDITLRGRLWRQLGKNGNVGIYDDFTYLSYYSTRPVKFYDSRDAQIFHMLLLTDKGASLIYRSPSFRGISGSLLRFINRRYHVHLHRPDFKTVRNMIDYILDKENKP
jgi:hypothetical protein